MTRATLASRTAAELASLGLAVFVTVWVSRAVGPANLGYYAVLLAVVQLGIVIVNSGLPTAATQRVANDASTSSDEWWTVSLGRLATAVVAVAAMVLLAALLPVGTPLRAFLAFGALAWIPQALRTEWLLVASGMVGSVSLIRVISASTSALLAFWFIRSPADAPFLPMLIVVQSAVAAGSSCLYARHRHLVSAMPSIAALRSRFREIRASSRHFLKADLSVYVYTSSDRLFLFAFASPATVGLYDAAYRIIQPFYSIASVASDSMYSGIAAAHRDRRISAAFRPYVDFMCVATIPLGFALLVFAPFVIDVVYGAAYAGSSEYLAILGWVITLGFTSGVASFPFTAWNLPREYGNAVTAGSATNLVLNVLLIPPFTGYGAALATVAGKAATTIVGVRYFRRSTDYPLLVDFAQFGAAAAAALLVSVIALEVTAGWDGLVAVLFGVVYLALVSVMRLPYYVSMRRRTPEPFDQAS